MNCSAYLEAVWLWLRLAYSAARLKTSRAMKMTAFFSLIVCLQVSANGSAQVTFSGDNVHIEKVFEAIRKQTGYMFLYNSEAVAKAKPVSVHVKNEELEEVLKICVKGQGFEYTIKQKTIFIIPRVSGSQSSGSLNAVTVNNPINVKGKVVDEDGKPLEGVTVTIKGGFYSTLTDANGEFTIGVEINAVLIFSAVNKEVFELKVTDQSMLAVKLKTNPDELEEFYKSGYQDILKERAPGSYVHLNKELLSRSVSTNILDRIFNVSSGLLHNTNQAYGDKYSITIRGLSTLNADSRPLIVVDGFPYNELPSDGNYNLNDRLISLNNLNPNDIESITILKDAAAASIWGAKSGNGVIVITTKKGRYNQRAGIAFNSTVNIIPKRDLFYQPIMSSKDAIGFQRDLFNNGSFDLYDDLYPAYNYFPALPQVAEIFLAQRRGDITEEVANSQIASLEKHDVRNDINKYLLRTAINQQYTLSVSGGAALYSYYASVGYDRNMENEIRNNNERITFTLNNEFRPLPNFSISGLLNYVTSNAENNGITINDVPLYTRFVSENGTSLALPRDYRLPYVDTAYFPGLLDWHYRPLDELKLNNNTNQSNSIRIGAAIGYSNIIPGLAVDLKFQFQKGTNGGEKLLSPDSYEARDLVNRFMSSNASGNLIYPVPPGGIIDRSFNELKSWNLRAQITYNKTWKKDRLSFIAGADRGENRSLGSFVRAYGYDKLTGTYMPTIDYNTFYTTRPSGSLERVPLGRNIYVPWTLGRNLSYFANGAYTFNGRYTISSSARIDGANTFGVNANRRINPLWSVGFLWDIAGEGFYKWNSLPLLKLRATYGFNGNTSSSVTSYTTITTISGAPITGYPFALLGNAPNADLQWEKVGIINIGIDFATNNNRFTGSIEYFHKNGIDLISPMKIDPTTGFGSYTGNDARIKGGGIDINLGALIINGKNFKWRNNFLFSYSNDKVTKHDFPATTASQYINGGGSYVVDKPIGAIFSYKWGGLSPVNGDPMGIVADTIASYNVVLSGTNTKPEDLKYIGPSAPRMFGSFLNTFHWRNLSVSFNIIYRFQYYFRRPSINYNFLYSNYSAHQDYGKRWIKPGDEVFTTVPSLPTASNTSRDLFYANSEILISRGDHIRLQDIRLAYEANNKLLRKLPVKEMRVFIYANNLGLIWRANEHNLDPDYIGFGTIPPSKTIALGLNLTF